jgi:hypothetical protein
MLSLSTVLGLSAGEHAATPTQSFPKWVNRSICDILVESKESIGSSKGNPR